MEENKTSTWEEYRKRTHVIGRVVSAVTLVMLVGAPFLMGKILGAYPDLGAVARAFLSVGLVWLVSSVGRVGGKTGTPENEIISTISIATSSLVTILVLAVGVLLMVPLQPVLQSEVLQPAFENVVPALFGAMAYKYYRKNMHIAVFPLVLMSALFIFAPGLIGSTSFMIIPSGAVAILVAWIFFKKGKKERKS